MNKSASQNNSISTSPNQRRQLLLGAGATLLLSACGGGGGGGDNGKTTNLREAYDKISRGMTKDEVLAIVGWEPNHKSDGSWVFLTDSERLFVAFGPYNELSGDRVTAAIWNTEHQTPGYSLEK